METITWRGRRLMFCKSCEYPLWNLTGRTCPECGTAFRPSEFDFRPESVRFCCPHCRQEYYGTSEQGHLVPRAFACVKCSAEIDMDEMVVVPRQGVDEQRTRAESLPWNERKRIGFFKGWFGTIGLAIGAPNRIARTIPDHGAWSALWYCVLTQFVFGIFGLYFIFLVPMLAGLFFGGLGLGGGGIVGVVVGLVGSALGLLVGVGAGVFLWSAITHGLLLVTGGARSGFGVTLSSICYAGGANFLSAIPCVGVYTTPLGGLWWMIVGAIVVTRRQSVNGWRATLAVVSPPTVGSVAGIALMVWWVTTLPGFGGAIGGSWYAQAQAPQLASALSSYEFSNGAFPAHAGELMSMPTLVISTTSFTADPSSIGTGIDPYLGAKSMNDLAVMTQFEVDQIVQAEVAAMPAGVIAHAVGDFVFTYHGLNSDTSDPGLWLFVAFGPSNVTNVTTNPDGSTNIVRGTPDFIVITELSGTTIELDPATWAQDLAAQNVLRVSEGLPPLPDLLSVTPESPAVSDSNGESP